MFQENINKNNLSLIGQRGFKMSAEATYEEKKENRVPYLAMNNSCPTKSDSGEELVTEGKELVTSKRKGVTTEVFLLVVLSLSNKSSSPVWRLSSNPTVLPWWGRDVPSPCPSLKSTRWFLQENDFRKIILYNTKFKMFKCVLNVVVSKLPLLCCKLPLLLQDKPARDYHTATMKAKKNIFAAGQLLYRELD